MNRRLSHGLRVVALLGISGGAVFFGQKMISLATATSEAVAVMAKAAPAHRSSGVTLSAQQIAQQEILLRRIDIALDNFRNADTIGFKRHRTDVDGFPIDFNQGGLEATGIDIDVAITERGFFHVKIDPTVGDGTGYTRVGALALNNRGDLIVNLGVGYELIPPISLPAGATNIGISSDGTITYTPKGDRRACKLGQIQLANFVNQQGLAMLMPQGDCIYSETVASGPPMIGNPGDNGTGSLQSGFLECSNVDRAKEWASLIAAEHSLQLNDDGQQLVDRMKQSVAAMDK